MASAIPESVDDWTLETVKRVVAEHPHEPDWLDYKETLAPDRDAQPRDREEHKNSIRRCACAMSNTHGGFIVFGVKDKGEGEGKIVGIDLKADLRKQFGDVIGVIDPNIRGFDAKPISLDTGGRGMWVVQLPVSSLRPHMLNGKFYKRTSGGTCEPMSAHEVREALLLREDTLRRLTVLRHTFQQMSQTFAGMKSREGHPHSEAARVDVASFRLLVGEVAHLMDSKLLEDVLELCTNGESMNRVYDWQHDHFVAARAHDPQYEVPESVFSLAVVGHVEGSLKRCKEGIAQLVASVLDKADE